MALVVPLAALVQQRVAALAILRPLGWSRVEWWRERDRCVVCVVWWHSYVVGQMQALEYVTFEMRAAACCMQLLGMGSR